MDPASSYLLLGLRLGRHVDGLVDFYYGPAELREQVESEPIRTPGDLVADATELAVELEGGSPWLREQVRGLRIYTGVLAGEPTRFPDEVEGCYGVRPEWVPEERFAEAHERLSDLLPGTGDLAARYERWRESRYVPRERIGTALRALVELFREWTSALVELPLGETIEVDLVDGEPWLAFNYYLGGFRSRIAVNAELPLTSRELVVLAAHETYPGHHAEHALKEALLVNGLGLVEESIALVPTPQCLVGEGLAMVGEELAFDATCTEVAAALGRCDIAFDAEHERAVDAAFRTLRWASENAALLLHDRGARAGEVVEYIERWRLLSRPRAQQALAFLSDPTWRAYSSTYVWGRRLCEEWVAGDLRRLVRLLTEQVTVGELRAASRWAS